MSMKTLSTTYEAAYTSDLDGAVYFATSGLSMFHAEPLTSICIQRSGNGNN